ncbi:MAG TPA: hypothetical protein VLT33_31370 [Labilithrix sp.]|nr:hypothetical protein [Labilithrix sp.]
MRAARSALALAALLVAFHLTLRAAGLALHTSARAGMPEGAWSLPLAALYVLAYLGAIVVAPILALAGVGRALLALRS